MLQSLDDLHSPWLYPLRYVCVPLALRSPITGPSTPAVASPGPSGGDLLSPPLPVLPGTPLPFLLAGPVAGSWSPCSSPAAPGPFLEPVLVQGPFPPPWLSPARWGPPGQQQATLWPLILAIPSAAPCHTTGAPLPPLAFSQGLGPCAPLPASDGGAGWPPPPRSTTALSLNQAGRERGSWAAMAAPPCHPGAAAMAQARRARGGRSGPRHQTCLNKGCPVHRCRLSSTGIFPNLHRQC